MAFLIEQQFQGILSTEMDKQLLLQNTLNKKSPELLRDFCLLGE
jgi:hypothetical protein